MSTIKTVFLVDDDQDDRFFIRQAIYEAGASVEIVEAENGLELLGFIQHESWSTSSLVLLDMNMPKMNGLETVAALRADPRTVLVPVVMISTSSNPTLVEIAYLAGVNEYITKPSSMEEFLRLSQQLIRQYKL